MVSPLPFHVKNKLHFWLWIKASALFRSFDVDHFYMKRRVYLALLRACIAARQTSTDAPVFVGFVVVQKLPFVVLHEVLVVDCSCRRFDNITTGILGYGYGVLSVSKRDVRTARNDSDGQPLHILYIVVWRVRVAAVSA